MGHGLEGGLVGLGLDSLELLEKCWMQSSSLSNRVACKMQGYQRLHAPAIEELQPKLWKESLPGTPFCRFSTLCDSTGFRARQDMASKRLSLVY